MKSKGIQLFFSHDVEQLAARLASEVLIEQQQSQLFVQPEVVVPNANMQRFLQLQLALHNGVCANVSFPFLETGLSAYINELTGRQVQPLNQDELSWAVWRFLLDEQWRSDPVYQPLNRYLAVVDNDRLHSVKHWQLSRKLAKLLMDYEAQRPEMVLDWLQGKARFAHSEDRQLRHLEALQKDLYLALNQQTGENSETLFQAMLRLAELPATDQFRVIHVFTPSRLSQLHRKILNLLGMHFRVHIYQLNVCREYWEDVQTPAESRWMQTSLSLAQQWPTLSTDAEGVVVQDPVMSEQFNELPPVDDENPLLSAWGKPGREALKLFSDLEAEAIHCEVQFTEQWLDSASSINDSLLHVIQQQILHRTHNTGQVRQHGALSSLQLAVAPSIEREVTAVYQSIVWNLNQDPALSLSDVAVLVTDMPAYRFVIEQVFEEHNRRLGLDIPYAIVDSTVATESRYADAVRDLLGLLDDQLSRASVFRWLDNPCVQTALGITTEDWAMWLELAAQLGIYAGFDGLYRLHEGDRAEPFTWQQGLQRLQLALAVELPDDQAAGFPLDAEALGQLTELINTLHEWQHRLHTPATTRQWQKLLQGLIEHLIAVPEDLPHEQGIQMALFESLNRLADVEPEWSLSWHDIRQFVLHELQQIPAGKGQYLTGGVVCAALQPMRPIPFRITYVLGLSETQFPGRVSKENLDLTHRSRRIGDLNTIETNQYLFLETLMCTRERLYLSYVGQDLVKDNIIAPSPVFNTLRQCASELLDPVALGFEELPVHELPLLAEHSGSFAAGGLDWPDIMVNFTPDEPKGQVIKVIEPVHDEVKSSEVVDLNLSELAGYLQNPQWQLLKKRGIEPRHPEDHSLTEHEPFSWPPLSRHQLFTDAVSRWLAEDASEPFSRVIEQCHQTMWQHSQAPFALYADLDKFATAEPDLLALAEQLRDHQWLGEVVVGDRPTEHQPGLALPAVELGLSDGRQVRLHGLAGRVWQSADGSLSQQQVISSRQQLGQWNDKLVMPFLNWCLWQLSDHPVATDHVVHVTCMDKNRSHRFRVITEGHFAFGQPATIRGYLSALAADYLTEVDGFLPLDKLSSLQVSYKEDVPQDVPFHHKKSKAKSINYLAYLLDNLNAEDRTELAETYHKALQWKAYDGVLQLVECQPTDDYLAAYRRRLLPLFYQVFGVPVDEARGIG